MSQVTQLVQHCPICVRAAASRSEPLVPIPLPDYPWQVLGSDLFEVRGIHYLLELTISRITRKRSSCLGPHPQQSSRHLRPCSLDTGSQRYLGATTAHSMPPTSSKSSRSNMDSDTSRATRYPQSNGQAECAVQTIKQLLKKQLQECTGDAYMALLTYRATPLPWCGLSPAEGALDGQTIEDNCTPDNRVAHS